MPGSFSLEGARIWFEEIPELFFLIWALEVFHYDGSYEL